MYYLSFFIAGVEMMLGRESAAFPLDRYPSVVALCWAVLRQFDGRALKPGRAPGSSGLGPGAQQRVLEAQCRDEFFRACAQILRGRLPALRVVGQSRCARTGAWTSLCATSAGP